MAFDFPASPTVGQVHAGYVWNGYAWTMTSNIAVAATPGDAPPAAPVSGQLWWETDTGDLYVWYVDANTSQWVQIGGSGLSDAPQDGGEYVRINGVWRIKSRRYDMTGLRFITIPVPSWAKKAKLKGMLQPGGTGQSYPLLQMATVAGAADTTAANYFAYGGQQATGNAQPTLWMNTSAASTLSGILVAPASDNMGAPTFFDCNVQLERADTSKVFGTDGHSASFHSAAGMQHMFWYVYWNAAGKTELRLAELVIINGTANNWAAPSFVEVEWS